MECKWWITLPNTFGPGAHMNKNTTKHLWPRGVYEQEYYQTPLAQGHKWRRIQPNIFGPGVQMKKNTTKHLSCKAFLKSGRACQKLWQWQCHPQSNFSLSHHCFCVCSTTLKPTTSIPGVLAFMTLAAIPKKKNQWREARNKGKEAHKTKWKMCQ